MCFVYDMLYKKPIGHKQYIFFFVIQVFLRVSIVAVMYKEGNKKLIEIISITNELLQKCSPLVIDLRK